MSWNTALPGTEDHCCQTSHWLSQEIKNSGFHLPLPHFENEGQYERERERERNMVSKGRNSLYSWYWWAWDGVSLHCHKSNKSEILQNIFKTPKFSSSQKKEDSYAFVTRKVMELHTLRNQLLLWSYSVFFIHQYILNVQ